MRGAERAKRVRRQRPHRLAAGHHSFKVVTRVRFPLGPQDMRFVLRSKIHKATVTETNLNYIGSLTIDEEILEKAGFLPGEKVLVVSITSGVRLETYLIPGKRNSGIVCVNGAAAHLIKKGEQIIIMGFELTDKPIKPTIILVDKENKFLRYL